MKNFLRNVRDAASTAWYNAGARLTVFLQTEPVRARSLALSGLVAVGTVIPALANSRVDELVAGLAVSAVTVGLGESARSKVSPTGK